MLILGLTGNIASGKSSVAADFTARGATVIDSDQAARNAVAPGTRGLAAIVARFGTRVLLADGSLDRASLGRQVFGDPDARRAVEQIVHPAVETARLDAIAIARARGVAIVVCDIPLLFEVRLAWQFARIIVVDAPTTTRIERLVRDRRMSEEDAAARVSAQMPAALKRTRADIVIDNTRDRAALQARLNDVWRRLLDWTAVAAPVRAA